MNGVLMDSVGMLAHRYLGQSHDVARGQPSTANRASIVPTRFAALPTCQRQRQHRPHVRPDEGTTNVIKSDVSARPSSRLLALGLVPVACVALAACSSSGSTGSTGSPSSSSVASTSGASASLFSMLPKSIQSKKEL